MLRQNFPLPILYRSYYIYTTLEGKREGGRDAGGPKSWFAEVSPVGVSSAEEGSVKAHLSSEV
jgi:hypothetical protein